MTVKLSVVIPTYNCCSLLMRCLSSLDSQTTSKSEFEVIVVDDGSSDKTLEIVEQFAQKSSLLLSILREPHQGPAIARNRGVATAKSDWIAFLDSDMVLTPNWIARGLALLRYHPKAGGFEGRTEIGQQEKVTPFTHQLNNLKGGRYQTCNLILRKSLCQFYPAYKIPFREDTDLAFTILEMGYEIVFDPALLAYHPPVHPKYDRPVRDAMRYYYDGLLARRFPHRYKNEVDVHYIGKMKFPHLRRKIYSAFAGSQLAFIFSMLLPSVPASWAWVLGLGHLSVFNLVVLIHLNHIQYAYLKWKDLLGITGIAYIVPWILLVQRWRGILAFKNEPSFSKEVNLRHQTGSVFPHQSSYYEHK